MSYQKSQNVDKLINDINNNFEIQQTNLASLNHNLNNIYIDKSNVFYNKEMFEEQYKLLQNVDFTKSHINKMFKLHLLNMEGFSSSKLMPKNKFADIEIIKFIQEHDVKKDVVLNNVNKFLLPQKVAESYNNYLLLDFERHKW
jgi:hypothetical protein